MGPRRERVHAVLEGRLYDAVSAVAKREGLTVAQKFRDLVSHSLALLEDAALEKFAEERSGTFRAGKAVRAEKFAKSAALPIPKALIVKKPVKRRARKPAAVKKPVKRGSPRVRKAPRARKRGGRR